MIPPEILLIMIVLIVLWMAIIGGIWAMLFAQGEREREAGFK